MRAAPEQLQRHFLVRFLQHDHETATRILTEEFGNRLGWVRRQNGLEDHNVSGELLDGRSGLIETLGLTDNSDIVLKSEDLAQPRAEDGLGIRDNHPDRTFAVLRLNPFAGLDTDCVAHRSATRPSSFSRPTRRALQSRATAVFLLQTNRFNYLPPKRYSSITTPTPRRPPSSKLRMTRPRQSTCTSASAPTTSAGRESVKSTAEPTGTSASIRNRTPLAEMFSVTTVLPVTA